MIGHDLAILNENRSLVRRRRYLKIIANHEEIKWLKTYSTKLQVAILWSLKEASFKCCSRNLHLSFRPKDHMLIKSVPQSFNNANAVDKNPFFMQKGFNDIFHLNNQLDTPWGLLNAKSIITENYVLSFVVKSFEEFGKIFWGLSQISNSTQINQSIKVREFASIHYGITLESRNSGQLTFRKNHFGAPDLYKDNQKTKACFSFTHQGNYISHAWLGR